ncbi:GIY-YIG nuclease family protein, partial [Flavobacterium plurextorum]
MDLYFVKILDQQKIKVGISENAKKRIVTIQNAGGYPDNQIYSNIFHNSGQFESTLKVLFKDYQIKGEWFEYKGLVEFF